MDIGVSVPTDANSWKIAQQAESLGFSHIWFYDTPSLYADPFVAMAAAAMKTSSIRLGIGVLIPSNRSPLTTANALASLNALAPGRIEFGVGTGWSGRRTIGLQKITLESFRKYIFTVKELLAGKEVECEIEGQQRTIAFLNPEVNLINLDDLIRLHVSAMGPKTQHLAAQVADDWMTVMMNPQDSMNSLTTMLQIWSRAGRVPDECYTTAVTLGAVLQDHETYDSPNIREQAGPLAAVLLHGMMESGMDSSPIPELQEAYERYRDIYASYTPSEAKYLTLHRGDICCSLEPRKMH